MLKELKVDLIEKTAIGGSYYQSLNKILILNLVSTFSIEPICMAQKNGKLENFFYLYFNENVSQYCVNKMF